MQKSPGSGPGLFLALPENASGCDISCSRVVPPHSNLAQSVSTIMIAARSWGLLALLASSSVLACDKSPTDNSDDLLGNAVLTVEKPGGNWTFNNGEAAFFLYSPGPTPGDRAMYLVLSADSKAQGPIEIEFFQFLQTNATGPEAGTYRTRYGALGGDPTLGGNVLFVEDTTLNQVFPLEDRSTVTLPEVTPERISGSVSMVLKKNRANAVADVRINGTFEAVRVQDFDDLPRPVSASRQ